MALKAKWREEGEMKRNSIAINENRRSEEAEISALKKTKRKQAENSAWRKLAAADKIIGRKWRIENGSK
jgi:hypothetical protein